jgi:ComF family protein
MDSAHPRLMGLFDVVVPPACAGCGAIGRILCPACRSSLRPPGHDRDRFVAPDPGVVIGESCELSVAAFEYEGPARRALAHLKYNGVRRIAPELALESFSRLQRLLLVTGPAVLVPIPLHVTRQRLRGYNQSRLIALALADRARLPVCDVLVRRRPTTVQHRLDRGARLRNLRGAFETTGPAPNVVVLVDDILTTVATLETCATVLRDAGARSVYGFAIARES